jgi:hypothetical protein
VSKQGLYLLQFAFGAVAKPVGMAAQIMRRKFGNPRSFCALLRNTPHHFLGHFGSPEGRIFKPRPQCEKVRRRSQECEMDIDQEKIKGNGPGTSATRQLSERAETSRLTSPVLA